jgi:hypothetical protein
MRLSLPASLIVASILACAGKSDSADSEVPVDTGETTDPYTGTTEPFSCPTPEIHVGGEDPPVVGNEWDVFLWCDSTLMTGPMSVMVDPPSLATIEKYHIVWVESGTAHLTVQVGSLKAERDVEVGP